MGLAQLPKFMFCSNGGHFECTVRSRVFIILEERRWWGWRLRLKDTDMGDLRVLAFPGKGRWISVKVPRNFIERRMSRKNGCNAVQDNATRTNVIQWLFLIIHMLIFTFLKCLVLFHVISCCHTSSRLATALTTHPSYLHFRRGENTDNPPSLTREGLDARASVALVFKR